MKNRRIPYGYEMKNGSIVICESESVIVKQIFADYIGGANYKSISDSLINRKVEYLPGETGWNKSRIKRMIEDKRYYGDNNYPAIFSEDTYIKANKIKEDRRTNTQYVTCAENKLLVSMIRCAECGGKLKHITDNTQKHSETWYCKTDNCKISIHLSISEVEQKVMELLNTVIIDPVLADRKDTALEATKSTEIRCMENDIERMIQSLDCENNQVQNLILKCASKKYDENNSNKHITDRLKAEFEKSNPLSTFSTDFLERTVKTVLLGKNNTISLVLKNGNIIGKELNDDTDTSIT